MTRKNGMDQGTYISETTLTYSKGDRLIVIEHVPVISRHNSDDDMLSADTLDRLQEWRTYLMSIPADDSNEQRVNFADYEERNTMGRIQREDQELAKLAS